MYGQRMETAEKLRQPCAFQPVWWKKNDQGRQQE
jgi:hypothetical protein